MYFGKLSIILLVASLAIINAQLKKRKISKTKIKKPSLTTLVAGCGCQNPLLDILNYRPIIEPVAISSPVPVIDIPNYRYADPIELNPLGRLFPPFEVPGYVEILPIVDGPCGCPEPACGCSRSCGCSGPCGCPEPACGCSRSCGCSGPCGCQPACGYRVPAVKLPVTPYDALEIPYSAIIEIPSFAPVCGCQGPCSCGGIPMSCDCVGPCGCSGIPLSSCGCSGPCSCGALPVSSCSCNGPCGCSGMSLPCGCSGPCGCAGLPSPCDCMGPCSCSGFSVPTCGCDGPCGCGLAPVSSCGCSGPCGCGNYGPYGYPGLPLSSCGCLGPCGCPNMPISSYGCPLDSSCGCGLPGCKCNPKYLRQVTLQPPCL